MRFLSGSVALMKDAVPGGAVAFEATLAWPADAVESPASSAAFGDTLLAEPFRMKPRLEARFVTVRGLLGDGPKPSPIAAFFDSSLRTRSKATEVGLIGLSMSG